MKFLKFFNLSIFLPLSIFSTICLSQQSVPATPTPLLPPPPIQEPKKDPEKEIIYKEKYDGYKYKVVPQASLKTTAATTNCNPKEPVPSKPRKPRPKPKCEPCPACPNVEPELITIEKIQVVYKPHEITLLAGYGANGMMVTDKPDGKQVDKFFGPIVGARYTGVIGSGPRGAVLGPSGNNLQIQFNDNNVFAGSSGFTFDKTTNAVTLTGNIAVYNANLGNLATANFLSGDGYLISNISASALGAIGNIVDANTGNINGNYLNTSGGVVGNLAMHITVSNNSDTLLDSFSTSLFRTAKYLIKAGNDTAYESIEVLLIHDNSNSYITVYGAVSTTDVDVINISSNVVDGNVMVYASGTASNTTVNLLSTYVKD